MPGPPGASGRNGLPGAKGEKRDTGLTGPRGRAGPSSGEAVYTRWGRITCPNVTGTQLVYHGRAGKTFYNVKEVVAGYRSYIYGVEYELPLSSALHDHNVPCAVCYVSTRATVLMIPGKLTCPSG